MSWYKKAQSISDKFPEVILYHGTLSSNATSIKFEGIVPKQIDADQKVNEGITTIIEELALTPAQQEEFESNEIISAARKRLTQSGDKIYASGSKRYAMSNASASQEWFETLLNKAVEIKYSNYFNLRHDFSARLSALYHELKKNDILVRDLQSQLGSEEIAQRLKDAYRKGHEIEKEISQLEKEQDSALNHLAQEIKQKQDKVLTKMFGKTVIIFKIVMPYKVFKSKLASDFSRRRVEEFEEQYRHYKAGESNNFFRHVAEGEYGPWDWLQEVHLSSVEPEYIRAYEEYNSR